MARLDVTRSERDLVTALRDELAAIDPSRPCDRVAEAAGLGPDPIRPRGRPAGVGSARPAAAPVGDDATDGAATPTVRPFDWAPAAEHCRVAWLRGRFLARGSLSLAGGRTHLEFVVAPDEAPVLAARLADIGLPASWRIRRGRGVVTSKSGEAVGTFLRRIGAAGALLEVEARQVSRALRGELNRVLNAESANLQRAVSAAGRQLDAIDDARGGRPAGRAAVRRPAGRRRAARDARGEPRRARRAARRSTARRSSARSSGSSAWPIARPMTRSSGRRAVDGPRLWHDSARCAT